MLILLVAALIIVVAAVLRPEARDSRLVRIGAVVLLGTAGMLAVLPSLATGLLFWFSAPIGVLLILIGTGLSFVKGDKGMHDDIAALAAAAQRTGRMWPDGPSLPQVDQVARHGLRAGPALVSLLRFESEGQLSDATWSPSVEQQVELALCRIYGELPSGTRTVYDMQATPAENRPVKQFWEARVRSAASR